MPRQYLKTLEEEKLKRLETIYLGRPDPVSAREKTVDRLEEFFASPKVRQNLLASLSEPERVLITLLHLLRETRMETLFSSAPLSRPEAERALYLLDNKLMVLSAGNTLSLNLEYDFTSIFTYEKLFPSRKAETGFPPLTFVQLAAFLNLFLVFGLPSHPSSAEKFLKSDFFPSHFPSLETQQTIRAAREINVFLQSQKLLEKDGNHQVLNGKAAVELLALRQDELLSLFVFGFSDERTVLFLDTLPHLNTNDEQTALKQLAALSKLLSLAPPPLETLESFSLLRREGALITFASSIPEVEETPVTLSSDLTLFTGGDSRAVKALSLIAEAERIDNLSSFRISRESIARALDIFKTSEAILDRLFSVTQAVPALVSRRIADWEAQYNRLSIEEGIVISTGEADAHILDTLPLLKIHIRKKLAPTVFLMNRNTESQWRRILVYAGFGLLQKCECEVQEEEENPLPVKATVKLKYQSIPFSANCEALRPLIEALPPTLKAKGENSLENGYIASPGQIDALAFQPCLEVSGFDIKAKANLLTKLAKERGRSCRIELDGELLTVTVRSVQKENSVILATLYDIKNGKEFTLPVSKLYSVSVLGF
jgi:hypothetical protein